MTVFVLFLIAALPNILENSVRDWERLDKSGYSEEELRAKFTEHPAYKAMYERFPDTKEDFTYYGEGDGSMMLGVINFENNNQLMLDLNYHDYEGKVRAGAYCNTESGRDGFYADELFAEGFIRNTDCLELTDDDKPVEP